MEKKELKIFGLEAVICDLDGVITQTAKIHMIAWKRMFEEFLKSKKKLTVSKRKMTESDYRKYIDGKPRYKGVESFLSSRKINLPFGEPADEPDKETVCGLGNRKNIIFRNLLKKEPVKVYEDAVSQIRLWREHGLKTAIVSSSRNCKLILENTGLEDLFDTRIDGVVADESHLKGKPSPDIFLEAAKRLETKPSKGVVFEDAISGVQAAHKGNFAFVIGVSRDKSKLGLLEHGGDIVIRDFHELNLFHNPGVEPYFTQVIPPVFSEKTELVELLRNNTPVIFLDYDGTLTPIVKHPEDALLSDEMRQILEDLAGNFKVAVITGRDLDEIKSMVQLDNIIYAGSHGYRISGPDGLMMEYKKAKKLLADLDNIVSYLKKNLVKRIDGIQIERKRYAIAIHYRNVKEENIQLISKTVDDVINKNKEFKKARGKKVFEIKPDLNWDKGKAVNWILRKLKLLKKNKVLPIYLGDDVTDEDAFKALIDRGIGILVGFHGSLSNAKYSLENVYQVKVFLQFLIQNA